MPARSPVRPAADGLWGQAAGSAGEPRHNHPTQPEPDARAPTRELYIYVARPTSRLPRDVASVAPSPAIGDECRQRHDCTRSIAPRARVDAPIRGSALTLWPTSQTDFGGRGPGRSAGHTNHLTRPSHYTRAPPRVSYSSMPQPSATRERRAATRACGARAAYPISVGPPR